MNQKRNQYVLRAIDFGNEVYIAPCLNGKTQITDSIQDAEIFDERDNLELKCKFQKACTGLNWKPVEL